MLRLNELAPRGQGFLHRDAPYKIHGIAAFHRFLPILTALCRVALANGT